MLKRDHRAPILAFSRYARTADDIADHPDAPAETRLAGLAAMRAGLAGAGAPEAETLARVLAERNLDPVHAYDLLDAFTQDVRVRRYANWDDLIGYCRLSAMPVGRFVLDVHGEDRAIWPLSDALCAALQVINHQPECAKDYRAINRVYLPLDTLAAHGATVEDLALPAATPALRATIVELADFTRTLLRTSADFAPAISSRRLAIEVAVIQRLAERLTDRLMTRDPLSERVHHRGFETMAIALRATFGQLIARVLSGA